MLSTLSPSPRRTPLLYLGTLCLAMQSLFLKAAATGGTVAPGQSLFTNAVTYCAEAQAIIVEDFDISYFRANESAVFYISAASVESDLDLTANIYANAYGMDLLNLTVDLCGLLDGVLCPLPEINFTGYGTYPLPSKYTSFLPGIAWSVPDLEAYAKITLIDSSSGEVKACLQATLSNGWSTRQKAVEISSGVFFIVALLVGMVFTTIWASPSPSIYRWYDILYIFQTVAISGLCHLNYPTAYSNFTLNFAWAIGLFYNATIESTVNSLRNKTGGKLSTTAYPAVDYINRKNSPYNTGVVVSSLSLRSLPEYTDITSMIKRGASYADHLNLRSVMTRAFDRSALTSLVKRVEIPTVNDQDYTSELLTGVPVYLNSLVMPTANGFLTIFFIYLIAIAVVLVAHLLWFAVMFAADRFRSEEKRGTGWVGRQRKGFWSFFGGNMLRLLLIFYFPVLVFAFYQFLIGRKDSWLAIILACLTLLWTIVPFLVLLGLSIHRSRKDYSEPLGVSPLYTRFRWFNSAGMVYRQYRQKYHFWWVVPLALSTFVKAAFVGFGASNPWAQVIGLVVVEFLVLVTFIVFRPHKDKKGDVLSIFLSVARMIAFGLLIAFIPSMGVSAIIRTVIGIVCIAVYGIPVLILFFGMFFNIGFGLLWRRHRERTEDGTEVIPPGTASNDETSSQEPAMRQVDLLGPSDSGFANESLVAPPSRRDTLEAPSAQASLAPSEKVQPAFGAGYNPTIDDDGPEEPYSPTSASHASHGYERPVSSGAYDHAHAQAAYSAVGQGGGQYQHGQQYDLAPEYYQRPASGNYDRRSYGAN